MSAERTGDLWKTSADGTTLWGVLKTFYVNAATD